ncbi:MAG: RNA polymerase subunit AC19 [Claussenomyces sp. TS43310]|nr:MAG: RNA polymerase subunit AC19 [Claussenomyces sp. TS43310]
MSSQTKKVTAAAEPSQEDITMDEAPAPVEDDHPILDRQMIRILPGSSDTAASFEFTGEDHTLGNALRYIIMKNPDVEFCGYSIPHPSEPKMNIRIQTYENTTAVDALDKGLDDLMDLCDVVADKFTVARNEFMADVAS